jgi:hypothetical protein
MILNHNGLSSVRGVIARDRFVCRLWANFSRPPRRVNARAGPVTRAASHVTRPAAYVNAVSWPEVRVRSEGTQLVRWGLRRIMLSFVAASQDYHRMVVALRDFAAD